MDDASMSQASSEYRNACRDEIAALNDEPARGLRCARVEWEVTETRRYSAWVDLMPDQTYETVVTQHDMLGPYETDIHQVGITRVSDREVHSFMEEE